MSIGADPRHGSYPGAFDVEACAAAPADMSEWLLWNACECEAACTCEEEDE